MALAALLKEHLIRRQLTPWGLYFYENGIAEIGYDDNV